MTKDAEGDRGVHRTRGNPAASLRLRMCQALLFLTVYESSVRGCFHRTEVQSEIRYWKISNSSQCYKMGAKRKNTAAKQLQSQMLNK